VALPGFFLVEDEEEAEVFFVPEGVEVPVEVWAWAVPRVGPDNAPMTTNAARCLENKPALNFVNWRARGNPRLM
jgi:hypothetical protein